MSTGRVQIVERSLLAKALNELHLQRSDLVDPKHAKAFGRITGADLLLMGSVTDLGGSLAVNLRLIGVETGEVIAAAKASIAKDQAVLALQRGAQSQTGANEEAVAQDGQADRKAEGTASDAGEAAASKGRTIFNGKGVCYRCHGKSGRGDGVAGTILNPRPTDLTDAGRLKYRTDEDRFRVIKHGVPGTGMVAFKDKLSDEEINAVIEYLHTFETAK